MTDSCPKRARWLVSRPDPAQVRALAQATGLSEITARVLASRGITTPEDARAFLEPSLSSEWVRAIAAIPGLRQAALRVCHAVRANERITVFGDFDLDGISAAAVATLGLRALGAEVVGIVPHRFREGYGLTPAAVARIVASRPALVVTVDCGISNAREVALLVEQGIDVVVTDHHEPGPGVPVGVSVADPKLTADGPPLAGAGVALALVSEAAAALGTDGVWESLTDLATLGTIADIVPLVGVNRALVRAGLERIRAGGRVGLVALAAAAGMEVRNIKAEHVAYGLAPRLNAAGRMADPDLALELLMTEDPSRAEALARALDGHNRSRQAAESTLLEAALDQATRVFRRGDRVLVVSGEGWHEGVRGIVASRLVARFGVPSLVFSIDADEAQGSGRSIEGVDLHATVASLAPLLSRYGGHASAVGVTLPASSLPTFTERLGEALQALPAAAFERSVTLDAEVGLADVSRELAYEFDLLEPFGYGNPRPLLAARGVFMNERRRVGASSDHLRFVAYDGASSVAAIAFRCPDIETFARTETPVDLAFEIGVDEWRGAERVQMLVRDLDVARPVADAPAAALLEELFEHADEILAREEYAGIGEAASFHTKLAGVTFEQRQEAVARLTPGMPLRVTRQPDNPHDPCACALFDPFGDQVGFFNRRLAAVLAPLIDAGVEYDVEVAEVTGGGPGEALGVNVLVSRRGDDAALDAEAARAAQERRRELAALERDALDAALVRHFISDARLHDAQEQALAHLAAGRSTLVVMATGRGKSLIFHLHAAREAIAHGRASVFVYPLRALVSDQAFHLEERFAEIGLSVRTLTGETPPAARDEAFSALVNASLDVVLTTPEFLEHHAARFAASGRVGFVVVDEAHHVGLARAGHRPAYARLDRTLAQLGHPQVLAVTATATDDVAGAIASALGVTAWVLDPTVRDNLRVTDVRGTADKTGYLASLAARGEKTVVYVNSREASVTIARQLRSRVPGLMHRCAFYNGGMTRESRWAVERALRDGELTTVVATSAFGEGVNIPDVRHVVLYHLPMGEVEFNQLCGRAGRDGAPSWVHLLFGEKDARLNRLILASAAPQRDDLAALYLVLRDIFRESGGWVEVTNADLAERVRARRPKSTLNEKGVSTGIGVFRELGLLESEGSGAYRRLTLLPAPAERLDLASSVRYAEGLDEIESFEAFRERALQASADELLHAFNRPILPTRSRVDAVAGP